MGRGKVWTEAEEGAALTRVFIEQGGISKTLYLIHGRPDEPTVEGMIWRAGGWNALMERHGLPKVWRGGKRPQRGCTVGDRVRLAKDEAPFQPIEEPKTRTCLNCRKVFLSVNYTCSTCRKRNQDYVPEFACL